MKKIFLFFGALFLLCSVSNANDFKNNKEISNPNNFGYENRFKKENQENNHKTSLDKEECCSKNKNIDEIEDDEYCTYNQCFFDKKYRELKTILCPTQRQEICMDNYYKNFKLDMENQCEKQKICKDEILKNIQCEKNCNKEKIRYLKELQKANKEKYKDFKEDIYDLLCKKQRKEFKKFHKKEAKKMKKMLKYATIYKFPCSNCCKN